MNMPTSTGDGYRGLVGYRYGKRGYSSTRHSRAFHNLHSHRLLIVRSIMHSMSIFSFNLFVASRLGAPEFDYVLKIIHLTHDFLHKLMVLGVILHLHQSIRLNLQYHDVSLLILTRM